MRKMWTIGAGALAAAVAGWVGASRVARHSGVTGQERERVLPGDDLVPGARVVMDRAVTLPAPPVQVWPWLAQLGKDRGGWYLPGWIEPVVPSARRGLRYIDKDYTQLAEGDEVPDWGPGDPVFRAVVVDPPRALVYLTARDRGNRHRWPESGPPFPPEALVASWALVLSETVTPDGSPGSRLQLRLRVNRVGKRAPWLVATLGGLMDEATVRPMFAGLAERVARPD
ncbi:MAG: hypothetical protein ABJB47_09780 [Actinomycetota bacterium]